MNSAKLTLRPRRRGGFTLVETILVVGAVAVMTTLGIAGVNRQRVVGAGLNCGNNLRLVQEAKRAALEENPTLTGFTPEILRPYLPGGRMPTCPGHGTYGNANSFLTSSCSLDSGRTDGLHNVHVPGTSGNTSGGGGVGINPGGGGVGPGGGGVVIDPGDGPIDGPILPPGDEEI